MHRPAMVIILSRAKPNGGANLEVTGLYPGDALFPAREPWNWINYFLLVDFFFWSA